MADYNTSLPIAGELKTKPMLAAADTYYVGMPLKYNDTNDNYDYSATVIKAVSLENKTLGAEGLLLCAITGSELLESGIVNDSGATLTVTDDARDTALGNGIILR